MSDEITPEMLRNAYTTIHQLQDRSALAAYAEGLSQARVILATLYPSVVGCRPGEDAKTMDRL